MTDRPASSSKSKTVRSQKITISSPSAENDESRDRALPIRSHTPGHLSSKSQSHSRRKASEPSIRQRSQSVVTKGAYTVPPPTHPTPAPKSFPVGSDAGGARDSGGGAGSSTEGAAEGKRPVNMRSTSAIASKPSSSSTTAAAQTARKPSSALRPRGPYVAFPPLQDPKMAPDVPAAPSSGMYWSRAAESGASHTPLRAHTMTLIGSNVFVFGGCDSRACFNELYVLDADSFHWSSPHVFGEVPVPLRAMTCTAVGKKLVVFGGGDGPAYYNDVYVLDTVNFRWHRPRLMGDKIPSARRAHTACLYKNGIYVFGGGDGVRALNDIWRLDVSDTNKMSWKLISGPSSGSPSRDNKPKARGYHTANMVGSKLIIYGGSDGGECFNDVWVYDVDTHVWKSVTIPITFRRLSHTSTIVGSYLFVVGGHDGNEYSNDVLLLNLVTMTWDKRKVYGLPPSGRGYHGTVLYDSRLVMIGGFDGGEVFSDVWLLELAVHAYYSQISHFSIEV
ncbi:kelch domain-containing protein [Seiridium cupressi]